MAAKVDWEGVFCLTALSKCKTSDTDGTYLKYTIWKVLTYVCIHETMTHNQDNEHIHHAQKFPHSSWQREEIIFFNVYLFLRERERACTSGGGAERERHTHTHTHTQTTKQASGCELSAQSPLRGLNPHTARSWPEPKSDAQPTEPPGHPGRRLFRYNFFSGKFVWKGDIWIEWSERIPSKDRAYISWCWDVRERMCFRGREKTASTLERCVRRKVAKPCRTWKARVRIWILF